MAEALSQDQRSAKLTTPLGADVLVLANMNAAESLSDLFEFHIEALTQQAKIDFIPPLGLPSPVEFNTPDGGTRYFSGLMTEAYWAGSNQDLSRYQLVLRPW